MRNRVKSPQSTHLKPAQIDWSDPAAPVSSQFDDVYFSKFDGAAETEYVFLQNNLLPERWKNHTRRHFAIAETGFGTGLNLMVTWHQFRRHLLQNPNARCQRLHFVSIEKFPLTVTDLSRAHKAWPEFAELAAELRQHYPPALTGCHRLILDSGNVTLDLWFDDVLDTLPGWNQGSSGIIDAWYLDGFAPSKNPEMWQPSLFENMSRLSRPDATFATFTAAGVVRRGLQAVGFSVEKVPGFGKKREMIRGTLAKEGEQPQQADSQSAKPIAIIGGGIAALTTAYALIRRGMPVQLFTADGIADGASGNRQGALYPLLNRGNDHLSRFFQQAFPLARQQVRQLSDTCELSHDFCGVLQIATNDESESRLKGLAITGFPKDIVHQVDGQQASHIAQLPLSRPGVFYPLGGWVSPAGWVKALLSLCKQYAQFEHHDHRRVTKLTCSDSGLVLHFDEQVSHFTQVVLAVGPAITDIVDPESVPITPVRGQLSHPATTSTTESLATVLCSDGYLLPAISGTHTAGASFGRGDSNADWRQADRDEIQQRLKNGFGEESWFKELEFDDSGRVSVRATVRDHLPIAGPFRYDDSSGKENDQQELYLLTGMGSRGLCSSTLCAELLASMICDEPRPINNELLKRVAPERFRKS